MSSREFKIFSTDEGASKVKQNLTDNSFTVTTT